MLRSAVTAVATSTQLADAPLGVPATWNTATFRVEYDVSDCGLEQVRSPQLGGLDELVGRLGNGDASALSRTGACGDGALGDDVGVSVEDGDALDRDAGSFRCEHGPCRVMALPIR